MVQQETQDELATTYGFGRLVPIRVIAHPDNETGNGRRVKHVEEKDHWSPVDLSFTGVDAGQMIHVIYATLRCIVRKKAMISRSGFCLGPSTALS